MKEFDFDSVWKKSDEQADEFYRSVEPKILEMAQQKSSDILQKLRSNMIKEWGLSLAGMIFLSIALYGTPYYSFIMIFSVILLAFYSIPYVSTLQKIKEASTLKTVEFIELNIEILDTFIKRLKFSTWVTMPFAMALGAFISIDDKSDFSKLIPETPGEILLIIVISLLVLGPIVWFTFKKYIPDLYGARKTEMEELLTYLKNPKE